MTLSYTSSAGVVTLGAIVLAGLAGGVGGCASKAADAKALGDGRPSAPLQVTAERVRPKSTAAKRPATELLDESASTPVAMAMASQRESENQSFDDSAGESPAVARAARGLEQMLRTSAGTSGSSAASAGGAASSSVEGADRPPTRAARLPAIRPDTEAGVTAPTRSRLRPPPIELPTFVPPPALPQGADASTSNVEELTSVRATGQTASAVFAPAAVATTSRTGLTDIPDARDLRTAVQAAQPLARSTSGAGATGQEAVLKIRHFAAASRVESFGRYTPMDLGQLAAGQPIAMLLYTELDGFAHRSPAGLPPPPDGMEAESDRGQTEWIVKVSQEVTVYGPGDVLVRAVPSQLARDVSKRRRRDHYLVQRLDLPRTLAAGEYRIKVSVKDEATGQVAESIIPMTIARGVAGR